MTQVIRLAMLSFIIPALLTVHILVCLLLVLVTLMQLPRSEGLGAAFGGSVTENMFGAQTTNVLAKFTVWLGVAFFAITLALAIAYTHKNMGKPVIQQKLMAEPVPVASPALSDADAAAKAKVLSDVQAAVTSAVAAPSVAPVSAASPAASVSPAASASPVAKPATSPAP